MLDQFFWSLIKCWPDKELDQFSNLWKSAVRLKCLNSFLVSDKVLTGCSTADTALKMLQRRGRVGKTTTDYWLFDVITMLKGQSVWLKRTYCMYIFTIDYRVCTDECTYEHLKFKWTVIDFSLDYLNNFNFRYLQYSTLKAYPTLEYTGTLVATLRTHSTHLHLLIPFFAGLVTHTMFLQ